MQGSVWDVTFTVCYRLGAVGALKYVEADGLARKVILPANPAPRVQARQLVLFERQRKEQLVRMQLSDHIRPEVLDLAPREHGIRGGVLALEDHKCCDGEGQA